MTARRARRTIALLGWLGWLGSLCAPAQAQTAINAPARALPTPTPAMAMASTGVLVIVPADSLVRQPNDEAHLTLAIEEQDRDKAEAASRVNRKMRQGTEIVRRADADAVLKTRGYYSVPIYAEEAPGKPVRNRPVVSWRIGQYLDVTTTRLAGLPALVAASQSVLTVSSLQFGLSAEAARRLDGRRIDATVQNLQERVAAIARAMGRAPADAVLETVDFDGSGAYAQTADTGMAKMNLRMNAAEAAAIAEPSFEPGETMLPMHLVAKVRFK